MGFIEQFGQFGLALLIGFVCLVVLGLIIAAVFDFMDNILPVLIGIFIIACIGAGIYTAIF